MTTRRPPDAPGPPTADELRELLARGLVELRAVDEHRLTQTWRRVVDQLDGDEQQDVDTDAPVERRHDDPTEDPERTTPTTTFLAAVDAPSAPAGAVSRLARFVPLAAAAAVALVVGVGVGLSWPRDAAPETPAAVATYQLEPLGAVDAAPANAVLLEDDGVRRLEVDLSTLPSTAGYHEVWLLDPSTGALASLGPVRPDNSYVVPPGTDLATLTALDVSDEPLDGDPGHSGDSLLRGEVTWTG